VGLALLLVAATTFGVLEAQASELRIGLPRLPGRLDPATVSGPERMIVPLLSQRLVELDDQGDVVPALATQWTVSRDSLTWTFRLRPDVRFASGAPLTPETVATSLARHLAPASAEEPPPGEGSEWARLFRGPAAVIQEVRAGEAGTVQIQLKVPFSPLLAVLAHPALSVGVTQSDSDVPFLGTGPYRVAERAPGRLVLEAVAAAPSSPRTQRLVFLETGDDPTGIGGLAPGGSLDVYFPQAPPAWGGLGLQVLSAPTWHMGLLALRSDDGLLAQKLVRQAVAASLDPGLIEPILRPWATLRGILLPPGAWTAPPDPGFVPHDPIRARRLLQTARAGSATLTLLVPVDRPGPDRERLAEAVRISLALSGLNVQVRAEAGDAYLRALRQGEGDLAIHELLASSAAVRGIATNVAFYRSASVDSMLTRAGQLSFRAERLRLYQRLQTLAADELPYVPLFVRLQWAVARPGVRGLRLDPGGLHRLERAWVETTPAAGGPPPSR
jgi:peptide/nickel transport system substrate-binding protein